MIHAQDCRNTAVRFRERVLEYKLDKKILSRIETEIVNACDRGGYNVHILLKGLNDDIMDDVIQYLHFRGYSTHYDSHSGILIVTWVRE